MEIGEIPTGAKGEKRPTDVIGATPSKVTGSLRAKKADDILNDGKDPAAMAHGPRAPSPDQGVGGGAVR